MLGGCPLGEWAKTGSIRRNFSVVTIPASLNSGAYKPTTCILHESEDFIFSLFFMQDSGVDWCNAISAKMYRSATQSVHILERYPDGAVGPNEAFIAFGGEGNQVHRRRADNRNGFFFNHPVKWLQTHVPFGKYQMSGPKSAY